MSDRVGFPPTKKTAAAQPRYKLHPHHHALQKFKCGGIESYNNLKAYIDLGGMFGGAGCVATKAMYYPNLWHNDTMIHLGDR